MSSTKCPECGLVNFATATKCKRCGHEFAEEQHGPATPSPVPSPQHAEQPDSKTTSFPVPGKSYVLTPSPVQSSYGPWLTLFAIFMIIRLMGDAYGFVDGVALWAGPGWLQITDAGGPFYDPATVSLFYFEQVTRICLIALTLVALVSFMKRSRSFPRWGMVLMICIVVASTVDIMWAASIAQRVTARLGDGFGKRVQQSISLLWTQLIIALCFFLLWFIYLRSSERLKSVFVK